MPPLSEEATPEPGRPSQLLLAWVPAAVRQAQHPLYRLGQQLRRFSAACSQRWQLLHLAQRCYLLAVLALLLALLGLIPAAVAFLLATVASMTAFTLDAWPQLEKFWHSLYGKALMIFVYAIFLNVVLAYAEASVNHLTGVKPDTMRYTVNLVALMLAPGWLIGGSALLMLLYMMLHLSKISLFLLLRPLGVRSKHFFEGEAYPLSSLLLRILLLPFTCIMLILMTDAYAEGRAYVKLDETYIGFAADAARDNQQQNSGQQGNQQQGSMQQGYQQQNSQQQNGGWHWISSEGPYPDDSKDKTYHWYEVLAADFLYQVESQGKSSCVLQAEEHGVQVGEFDLLVIKPDKSQASGYHFSVRPCNSPGQQQWLQAGAVVKAAAG